MEGPLTPAARAAVVPTDAEIRALLSTARAVAIVGASPNPHRPSYEIMAFLLARGIRCHPVNPAAVGEEILGQAVAARIADVPAPIDIVDVFRNSAFAGAAVDEAIAVCRRLALRGVWLQLGVHDDEAMTRATAAGLIAVQNRCLLTEYMRLFGR